MVQQDTSPIKNKIISFIEKNGPSLPAHIASEIEQSILFSSAFLAELLSEKKLVLSHMRVGSSPLYLIAGQEPLLEKYAVHLGGKPGEAYSLLKEKRFLKDSEQLPAIRVALRSIKDFAKPFKFKDEVYWRYLTEDVNVFLKEKNLVEKPVVLKNEEIKKEKVEVKEVVVSAEAHPAVENKKEESQKKSEVKKIERASVSVESNDEMAFVKKVREYLKKEKIIVLEETSAKRREFLGRGRIQSDVGEMEILIIGKDKKNIVESDIEKVMLEAVERKMLVLFLSTGEIIKRAKDIYREHKNLIRFIRI